MAEPERLTQGVLEAKKRRVLEYPLNNPDDYKGRLVFTVLEDPETDLSNIVDVVAGAAERVAENEGVESTPENSKHTTHTTCLLYTSPSPRDGLLSRMPSSA